MYWSERAEGGPPNCLKWVKNIRQVEQMRYNEILKYHGICNDTIQYDRVQYNTIQKYYNIIR